MADYKDSRGKVRHLKAEKAEKATFGALVKALSPKKKRKMREGMAQNAKKGK